MPGRVGAYKGVSEGVRECMAWFRGLGVCSLVSKRYVHEFSPCIFIPGDFFLWVLLHGLFSVGLRGGPRTCMVVDSVSLQGSSLEMACLLGARWDLSHPPNRRDPTRQLKPGTVAPRCGEDN